MKTRRDIRITILAAALLLAACKDGGTTVKDKDPAPLTSETVTDDMVDIDAIMACEQIVADTTLRDANGETTWHQVGAGIVRIRHKGRYYLRMETQNGTVTAVTYRYAD